MTQLCRRIRLLHIIGTFLHGGTEKLMLDILSHLPQDTYSITACSEDNQLLPDVIGEYHRAGIDTIVLPYPLRLQYVPRLTRMIRRGGFDVVHTHHYYANIYARIAAILAGTPTVMTYQHNWPGEEKGRHRLAFRLLNHWTYRNIVVSEAIRRYDIEEMGITPGKVVTLYNGVDTTVFHPTPVQRPDRIRLESNLPSECVVVGAAGRLVEFKRFDLLLRAARLVLKNQPQVRFLIAGDGPLRPALEALSAELGIADHVRFLGWRTDMPTVYRAMDIFCMMSEAGGDSWSEGFGLVSAEAMASGVPVVAVDTAVNREVITPACGLFCQPTPEDIAAKVALLADDVELRAKLGHNGRARAEQHFDIQQAADKLSGLYLEAMGFRHEQPVPDKGAND